MNIVNMTPRTVRVVIDGRLVTEYPPSGRVTTYRDTAVPFRLPSGIPVLTSTEPQISDLPEPSPDTLYIVFSDVRRHYPDRHDLISTGGMTQSQDPTVCICRHFRVNPKTAVQESLEAVEK